MLAELIADEAAGHGVRSFSESIAATHAAGLIQDGAGASSWPPTPRVLDALIAPEADDRFEYFGLRTVYDRYLLRHPSTRKVLETPAALLPPGGLRRCRETRRGGRRAVRADVHAVLPAELADAVQLRHRARAQLSSCFLLDSPRDELEAIYERYGQVARLSKYAGGIGIAWTRVRSRGSLIRGTNGHSNGIVPWLQHAGLLRRRGQPGRQAQGRGLRLPGVLARRHRGVPRTARQHRRGGPPHAQPEPGQLDPGRVHAPGRGRRRLVAVRPQGGARTSPTCTAPRSTRPTGPPRPRAAFARQSRPATCTGG